VRSICTLYKALDKHLKCHFINSMAKEFSVDSDKVKTAATNVFEVADSNPARLAKSYDSLRNSLTPHYSHLFKRIGRLENGVKFLVDLRTDVLVSIWASIDY